MSIRSTPPRIAPFLVVTTERHDHAELQRRIPRAMPARPELLQLLHPLRRVADQWPAFDVGGLVVVAPRATQLVAQVASLCALAATRGVPVVLVRWTRPDDDTTWPVHPVHVVADVLPSDVHDVRDALVRAFLEQPPAVAPFSHDDGASLSLLQGDTRCVALRRELEARNIAHEVVGVVDPSCHTQPGPALRFRPRLRAPSSTELCPLQHECIDGDPRSYAGSVDPADDPMRQARAIAALHVGHGAWGATLAAVDACANGDADLASELLMALSDALRAPRLLLHRDLVARARAQAPAETEPEVGSANDEERAFWARVDALFA